MPLGLQYVRLILSRWRLVAGLVLGCTLGAWLFSALVLAQNPTFESAARLNIVPTSEELGYANRFVRGSTFDGGAVLLQTYAEFARTQPIVAPIVDRYITDQARKGGQTDAAWIEANSVPPAFSPGRIVAELNYGQAPNIPLRQDLIDTVIKSTKIETVEGTYLIRISVEWDDPQSAAWFANALADAIMERAEKMSRSSGTQIAGSLEGRLLTKKAELADLLRRSREMKASIGVVDLDRQKQALLEAQMAEQSRLTSDRADLQSSESQVAGLRRQTGGKLSSSQAMVEQTLALEGPKVSGLKQGIAIRQGRVGQIGAQLATLGKSEIAIKTIDDQAAALQTEVAALTERVSFSQTENLANAPRIQLVERASPPLLRSSPKTLFNTILGFIAGCALAGCALLLLGDAKPRHADDARETEEAPAARAAEPVIAKPFFDEPAPPPVSSPLSVPTPPVAQPVRHDPPPAPAPKAEPESESEPAPRPSFREWQAAGRNTVRRPVGTAGNLAIKATPDFAPDPARHASQPLRIVPSEPRAAPALAMAVDPIMVPVPVAAPVAYPVMASASHTGLLFPDILPRPANGLAYRNDEIDSHGRRIVHWLADEVDAEGRPILIVAAGADVDAQCFYQLLHDYLKQQGIRVRTLDGAAHVIGTLERDARKPLIYGGGLGEGGRLAILREIDHDVPIVLLVRAGEREDVVAALDASSQGIAGMARKQPYAIAIGG